METKDRIDRLDLTMAEIVYKLSGGNPGAVSVCCQLLNRNPLVLLNLDSMRVYESDIWVLYKNCCGEDIESMLLVLDNWRRGKITEEEIHAHIADCAAFEIVGSL